MSRAFVAALLALALPTALAAIPGIPDHVPAASLLVPFFETGINPAVNPDDTLLAVTNYRFADKLVHVQVWDRDGNAVALAANVTIPALGTWTAAMRDLINVASAGTKTALTVGDFYRGFVTIDVVTVPTVLTPLSGSYPFSVDNALEGYVYYARLLQGSANGLAMVPLEAVSPSLNGLLIDFYSGGGGREEIDADARLCAQQLASGETCDGNADGLIDRIHVRQFGSAPLNGTTRVIVFTWNTFRTGAGPSVLCDTDPGCDSVYPYKRYDSDGNTIVDSTIRLDHVVNVVRIAAPTSGWVSIWNVPSVGRDLQVYAFSFNSASPGFDPSQSWDAIFEGYIVP